MSARSLMGMSSRFIANLCSPLDPIDQYDIALDRQVYFPGDVVSGTLTLATSDDVDAKAVNLELVGRASARYFSANQVQRRPAELAPHGVLLKHCVHIVRSAKRHPNVGALTEEVSKPSSFDFEKHKERVYVRERITVWGNIVKTLTIDGAGTSAYFAPPWAPAEGEIVVSVPAGGKRHLVLCVMDEDWGRFNTDDKLGEVLLDPAEIATGIQQTHQLRRKGKTGFGSVKLMASWADEMAGLRDRLATYQVLSGSDGRLMHIKIIECRDLKDSDLFSANDVYCMVYALPAGAPADESKRLPSPSEVVTTLKPCQIVIPFEFKLPERIPPSIEHGRSFVRYSIYSCIDVEWKKDPSTRAFFTVLTRNPIEFMYPHVPQPMHGSSESQKPLPRCCGLLPGKKQEGKMTLLITTTRKGFAPGELIPLDIQVHNKSSKPASLSVSLMRHFRGETFKGISRWAQEICSLDAHHEVLPGEKTNVVGELLLPPIPPTFKGSDPAYMEDLRWLVRHPRGERWAPAEGMKGHPISWHYKIEADVTTEGPGPTVSHAMDVTILAFPPCAAPDVQILGKAVEPSSSWVADKPRAAPVVVYVPDPHQGPMNVGDPLLDMHSFKAEALVWAPLCPLSKPGAWPEAEAPLPAARALQPV